MPRRCITSISHCHSSVSRRYKDFRDNNGKFTLFYWELLAIRLGFIIAFEVGAPPGISCYLFYFRLVILFI